MGHCPLPPHLSFQGRFTCFDQYKNHRYENEGARIDYTIIDGSLLPYVQAPNSTAALVKAKGCSNPLCEACALAAITGFGHWKPAPFEGTGIMEGQPQVGQGWSEMMTCL